MKTSTTFRTAGDSLYSNQARVVGIVDLRITYVSEDKDFGELCVYFDTNTWNTRKDGLIYTDSQFMVDLCAFFTENDLSTNISYSEAGMQGDGYVSFDVMGAFIPMWEEKFGEVVL